LLMLGFLSVAAGAVGLVLRLRETGRFGWLARAGGVVCMVGFALAVLAAITAAMTGGMSPLMPYFVVPGPGRHPRPRGRSWSLARPERRGLVS
jgi:hypothetical protein